MLQASQRASRSIYPTAVTLPLFWSYPSVAYFYTAGKKRTDVTKTWWGTCRDVRRGGELAGQVGKGAGVNGGWGGEECSQPSRARC